MICIEVVLMKTFGRGVLYSIIAITVLLHISMITWETITLAWYIFLPLVVLIWGLKFYQSSRESGKERVFMKKHLQESACLVA